MRWIIVVLWALLSSQAWAQMGPLVTHPDNGRYFSATGFSGSKAIYLTGSYTWSNLQDGDGNGFDYTAYLNTIVANGHNTIRLWTADTPKADNGNVPAPGFNGTTPYYTTVEPTPYARSGVCCAADGGNKYDLTTFNQAYFDRLRDRVAGARDRNLYVIVTLFNWHGAVGSGGRNPWTYNPYRSANNTNAVNGDTNADGNGEELFTVDSSSWLDRQKAFVHKVVDTLNDLDNVIYETCHDCGAGSEVAWHNSIIDDLNTYQATNTNQHPACFTGAGTTYTDANLLTDNQGSCTAFGATTFDGSAESWNVDPPSKTGKVVLSDSSHLFYSLGRTDADFMRRWVWKTFVRGYHPLLVEDLSSSSGWVAGRQAMGQTKVYADKMQLFGMTPQGSLTSTNYALAKTGSEYLVLAPTGGSFTVTVMAGTYSYEWYNPVANLIHSSGTATYTAGAQSFTPPFSGIAVLYLKNTTAQSGSGDLAVWLRLDQSSGTTATDSSTYGRNGTLINGPTWTTGVEGNALSFDGVDDYVSIPTSGLPAPNQPQTIAFWTNVTSVPTTYHEMLSISNTSASSSIEMILNDSKWQVVKFGSIGGLLLETPAASGWHHLAYTYDGSTHRLYVDGVLQNTSTVTPQSAPPTLFYLGRWASAEAPDYFAGKLDDVRLYTKALTQAEVAALIGTPPTIVSLTWADNNPDNTTGSEDYTIVQKRSSVTAQAWTEIARVARNVTSYQSTLASGETADCYRVAAGNTAGVSAWSSEACQSGGSTLSAPINLTATLISSSPPTIRLSWTTVPGAASYGVYLHALSTPYDPCSSMAVCTDVTTNSVTAHIQFGISYDWWVVPKDALGNAGQSAGNQFLQQSTVLTTPPTPGYVPTGQPANFRLALVSVSPVTVQAKWDMMQQATAYKVTVEDTSLLGLPCEQLVYCASTASTLVRVPASFNRTYRVTVTPLLADGSYGDPVTDTYGTPVSLGAVKLSLTLLRYGIRDAVSACAQLATCTVADLSQMMEQNLATLPE